MEMAPLDGCSDHGKFPYSTGATRMMLERPLAIPSDDAGHQIELLEGRCHLQWMDDDMTGTSSQASRPSTTAVALVLVLVGALPQVIASSSPHARAHQMGGSRMVALHSRAPMPAGGRVGALWMALNRPPTRDEIAAVRHDYAVVVLNASYTRSLRYFRQLAPNVTVLTYKDLSSTRDDAVQGGRDLESGPTGVGYLEANDEWFAGDTTGQRIEWAPYPHHWQMAVWDPAYQDRWVANVTDEAVRSGWDGVFADNALRGIGSYAPGKILQGTDGQSASDSKVANGIEDLVTKAGHALNQAGKLLIPNVPDGRLDLGRWDRLSSFGGAMDENFAHWGTDRDEGYITDWGPTGWVSQTEELRAPLSLVITRASRRDAAALRYGFASAKIRAIGRVVWTAETDGIYQNPEIFAWQHAHLGPGRQAKRLPAGIWRRHFKHGSLYVNPTSVRVAVRTHRKWCAARGGAAPRSFTLRPHDAKLLFLRKGPCRPML